ncbi:hypothetical protein HPP92_015827 [Vanilla planifolia]|uniref:RING-type domain-containing protein n=1 Tax=Vanilla planifolia TaxID=51239 RepID=A0A835UTM1_VANPL|nr:hypothetical protein HPP92_015827 [Vanilla planifolia]
MAVPVLDAQGGGDSVRDPFLMDHSVNYREHEHNHVIDVTRHDNTSISIAQGRDNAPDEMQNEDRPSTSSLANAPTLSPLPTTPPSSSSPSLGRRSNNHTRRREVPNSGLWISIELVVNLSQIVAAIVVLSLSRHEHPRAPLFAWVIGYTLGCAFTLPHLYWRYMHRRFDQELEPLHQRSFRNNSAESTYAEFSITQAIEGSLGRSTTTVSWLTRSFIVASSRLNVLVDHFKMALDCFFAVWFVVGNVWVFVGIPLHQMLQTYTAFLTFSCIGYAMPFILCATVCCCLPCLISLLGLREDLALNRGATSESINALPTYKFKSARNQSRGSTEINYENFEGGILAAGTERERFISPEDAACCICLTRYAENDELRELPCTHFFHTHCVDKWLKINALCPLCKYAVGHSAGLSSFLGSLRFSSNQRVGGNADAAESRV